MGNTVKYREQNGENTTVKYTRFAISVTLNLQSAMVVGFTIGMGGDTISIGTGGLWTDQPSS